MKAPRYHVSRPRLLPYRLLDTSPRKPRLLHFSTALRSPRNVLFALFFILAIAFSSRNIDFLSTVTHLSFEAVTTDHPAAPPPPNPPFHNQGGSPVENVVAYGADARGKADAPESAHMAPQTLSAGVGEAAGRKGETAFGRMPARGNALRGDADHQPPKIRPLAEQGDDSQNDATKTVSLEFAQREAAAETDGTDNGVSPHVGSKGSSPQATEAINEQSGIKSGIQEQKQDPPIASLRSTLNFTDKTAVNFMHFHKTGGVSFKTLLHVFYQNKRKSSGAAVTIRDACYKRENAPTHAGQPSFATWRCDWGQLRELDTPSRDAHDFVFGHQFAGGAQDVRQLLRGRDVQTFTVMRHPFDRKTSFFYHFFVREVGRKEEDVSFEEVREFLLFDRLKGEAALGRDLGPNYMAGRVLSDGVQGYVGDAYHRYYAVGEGEVGEVVRRAMGEIEQYVFVGLQHESAASQCMLQGVMRAFNEVNGVDGGGLRQVGGGRRDNSGGYSLSAGEIWRRLSKQDRAAFERKEEVDLSIYRQGERLFAEHVRLFGCAHLVQGGADGL